MMLQESQLKQYIQEITKELAEILTQDNLQKGKLLTETAQSAKIEHELQSQFESNINTMKNGLTAIINSLRECTDLPLSVDQVIEELYGCLRSIKSVHDLNKIAQSLFSEISLKTYLSISNTCMEALYIGAKNLFDLKEYNHAQQAFFVLCTLDPTQFVHWIGFAHTNFQNKNYQEAINSYAMASALDPTNIWPHIWAANTFEAMNDFHHASMALQNALDQLAQEVPKNQELIQTVEERIKKNSAIAR